jgi:hypothetical protein
MLEKIDLYIGMAVAGLFTGLGSTLGSYLINKHLIKNLENISKKLRRKKK